VRGDEDSDDHAGEKAVGHAGVVAEAVVEAGGDADEDGEEADPERNAEEAEGGAGEVEEKAEEDGVMAGVGAEEGGDVGIGSRVGRSEETPGNESGGGEADEKENPRGDSALVMWEGFIFGEPASGEDRHGREGGDEVEFLTRGEAEEHQDNEDPEKTEEAGFAAAVGVG